MRLFTVRGAAASLFALVLAGSLHAQTPPPQTGVGYSPGRDFDVLSWGTFITAVTPARAPAPAGTVTFQTWATDAETFPPSGTPVWPGTTPQGGQQVEALRAHLRNPFQPSALGRARAHLPHIQLQTGATGELPPCSKPGDAAAGNFPTPATATANCYAEEVTRNRAAFEFIVTQNLYSQAGLATNFASATPIAFPTDALEVKTDWVPVHTVAVWLTNNQGKSQVVIPDEFVRQNYFLTQQDGIEYALVSMHINSKILPNWLWVTFEHQFNPGRCDTMGCYDKFGAKAAQSDVRPHKVANTRYPNCGKSDDLVTLFDRAGLASVWKNYCLKETQVDYVSTQAASKGRPVLGGDSFTERVAAAVPIAQSSCISCHKYASFGAKGCVDFSGNPGLNSPAPIGNTTPQAGQKEYDFVWGLIAINDTAPCN